MKLFCFLEGTWIVLLSATPSFGTAKYKCFKVGNDEPYKHIFIYIHVHTPYAHIHRCTLLKKASNTVLFVSIFFPSGMVVSKFQFKLVF